MSLAAGRPSSGAAGLPRADRLPCGRTHRARLAGGEERPAAGHGTASLEMVDCAVTVPGRVTESWAAAVTVPSVSRSRRWRAQCARGS